MARPREFDEAQALRDALNVFWQRGYNAAGMQELCAGMGLNPGSVYGAYGSKRDLYLAALRQYLSDAIDDGISMIDAAPSGGEGIRVYFDYLIDGITSGNRKWGCFGTNSYVEMGERDPEIRQLMQDHFARLEQGFRRAIQRDLGTDANGSTDPLDSAIVDIRATFLLSIAHGLNVLARSRPSHAQLTGIVDQALAGLVPQIRDVA